MKSLKFILVLVIIAIAYLSLTPTDTITIGNDKISHFIAYGSLMTIVGLLTFQTRKRFFLGIILALFYGAILEIAQYYVPGRFMSFYDLIANATGVFIGIVITIFIYDPVHNLLNRLGVK